MKLEWKVENPWFRVKNHEKRGEADWDGDEIPNKEIYSIVTKAVGKIRVIYEVRPYQETRPLSKTGSTSGVPVVQLRVQIQWPRNIRKYCEEHFKAIRLGCATNQRCACDRFNISNQDEVMCHTCALFKRCCAVCEAAVDVDKEEALVRKEVKRLGIEVPEEVYPLQFEWLRRLDDPQEEGDDQA